MIFLSFSCKLRLLFWEKYLFILIHDISLKISIMFATLLISALFYLVDWCIDLEIISKSALVDDIHRHLGCLFFNVAGQEFIDSLLHIFTTLNVYFFN